MKCYYLYTDSIYTYSLKQGIEDGFLAPYRVHRVVPSVDATGWRPTPGELDRYGREIPDGEYSTNDFETLISLKVRTEAIAKHLADYLKKTNRFDKTIVFCVDQEHAEDMRKALNNLNSDLVRKYPDYVCRVVSEEGDIGRGHLSRFQELETETPSILTTSKLLTTGVDMPTCKNVVLVKVINSMTDFKQIIGRGTRVKDDYGKLYFTILDYTGSATGLFADPDFDGEPALITEEEINNHGDTVGVPINITSQEGEEYLTEVGFGEGRVNENLDNIEKPSRKYYIDNGSVEILADIVYELDADGKQLRVVKLRRPVGGKKPGRCGIVVPNGTLFGDGVCARIKEELLKNFNLHTIVRLPNGVFSPYTGIPTNLLFFDRNGPTKEIWYYEQPLPEGRKSYTKTKPMQFEEFEGCIKWWNKRKENEHSWKVKAEDVATNNYNLDIKNPNAKDDFEHMPPEQLAEDIIKKEQRISEIMAEIKQVLDKGMNT